MRQYMYVSLGGIAEIPGEDKILVFAMDPETGRLDPRGPVAVTGGPAPLAIDPGRRFLYVGRRRARAISGYRIDWNTGGLEPVDTVAVEGEPVYLATDRKGKFLLSAYLYDGKIGVHSIHEGTVVAPPIQWLDTAVGVHSVQTDPTNRFVFAPHVAANFVLQCKFDAVTGRLTPNTPSKIDAEAGAGPRHFCFHPSLDVIYVTNEPGSSVTAYRYSSTGLLSALQTISTLPGNYAGTSKCAKIQILPSGRFLYAPNRGHNSISCFSVDSRTGRLASVGWVPTEPKPRALSLDPEGKFLFACGAESGRMASYRVDADSGGLEPLETYTVGGRPMWVLITRDVDEKRQ